MVWLLAALIVLTALGSGWWLGTKLADRRLDRGNDCCGQPIGACSCWDD